MRQIIEGLIDAIPSLRYETLLFPSYRSVLLRILLGMAASFVLFGFFYPYWRYADQDLILAYQGLLLNDGLPQEYFDHTGYLYDLAISGWYTLCHQLGFLPIDRLSQLPSAGDAAAFDLTWQQLVEAGRILSLMFAAALVCIFSMGVRFLVGDWRIAAVAGFAVGFSGSLTMHMRIMRTELLSAGMCMLALLAILIASHASGRREWRPLWLGLSALCATLAVVTKVQAFLLVTTFPAIALAFGTRAHDGIDRRDTPKAAQRWVAALVLVTLLAAIPAAELFYRGMIEVAQSTIPYPKLGIIPVGGYQTLVVFWIALAMIAYAKIWGVPIADTVAAMAAVTMGISLGLLSLELRFHEQNLLAVTHPVEHMFVYASWSSSELAREPQILSGSLFAALLRGFATTMAAHTFVLHSSSRPTLMLEWLAIVGAVMLWLRGERRLIGQVGLLLLITWGLDTAFTLRGLKLEYFIYTDPLLIIAAALVAMRFANLEIPMRAQKAAACLFLLYLIWGQANPVKALLSHDGPEEGCWWIAAYLSKVERFPFCRQGS